MMFGSAPVNVGEMIIWEPIKKDIETQMVTVEGPAPRFSRGRNPEEKKVVRVLVHDLWHVAKLSQEMIYPHGSECFIVPLRREC